jgi:hypothetical protein
MDNASFNTHFWVPQSPKEAFDAITNVRGWWSREITGGTQKLNDEFTYRYQDVHHCTMRLIEVVPEKKVVWLVLDNYFNFTEDKTEWKGNTMVFDIGEKDGRTQVRFTQNGLVPDYECYDVCNNAWTNYIGNSLRLLIMTGKGQPNPKES